MNQLINEAIEAIDQGNIETGRRKLQSLLATDLSHEQALFLLESITEDPKEKAKILERILFYNPNSKTLPFKCGRGEVGN
ncbi:MAG: hypothetical protein GY943_21585 [Chloroflexi bacterium]|nr:hypothetical protein [Chloroflexota bacterium]